MEGARNIGSIDANHEVPCVQAHFISWAAANDAAKNARLLSSDSEAEARMRPG